MTKKQFCISGGVDALLDMSGLEQLHRYMFRFTREQAGELFVLRRGTWIVLNHEQGVWHRYCRPDRFDRSVAAVQSSYGWRSIHDPGVLQEFIALGGELMGKTLQMKSFWGLPEDKQQEFEERCLKIARSLENARKPEKLKIRWWVANARDGIDSLGRRNPGAAMAQLSSASLAARQLVREVIRICEHIDIRQVVVRREILRHEREIVMFHATVKSVLGNLRENSGDQPVAGAIRELKKLSREMQRVDDQPFRNNYRRCVNEDIGPAVWMLCKGRRGESYKYLERLLFALEILQLGREFAELLYRISLELRRTPHKPESKRRKRQRLELCRQELEFMVGTIPGRVEMPSGAWRVDEFLRGTTLQSFEGRAKRALTYWNRAIEDPHNSAEHFSEAKEWLREAELAW